MTPGEEFIPKRVCSPRPTRTKIEITKDVLKLRFGPADLLQTNLTSPITSCIGVGGRVGV